MRNLSGTCKADDVIHRRDARSCVCSGFRIYIVFQICVIKVERFGINCARQYLSTHHLPPPYQIGCAIYPNPSNTEGELNLETHGGYPEESNI